jgi:hypothetical protein
MMQQSSLSEDNEQESLALRCGQGSDSDGWSFCACIHIDTVQGFIPVWGRIKSTECSNKAHDVPIQIDVALLPLSNLSGS